MHRVVLVLAISTLTSCLVAYQPPAQPVPMFTQKGQAQAFLGYRNAGLSYALTNKFGLSLDGYYRKKSNYYAL